MVRSCCVNGCSNKSHDGKGRKLNHGARFFRFPTWKKSHGQQVEEITKRRRMAWVAAVRRKNITFAKISPFMYVCSRHFYKGQPAYEMMETDPDWAPSLHLGHVDTKRPDTARSARQNKREQLRKNALQPAETSADGTRESDQVRDGSVQAAPGPELPAQSCAALAHRPGLKILLADAQPSGSSCSPAGQKVKTEGGLHERVFSEKENTPAPLSCSEVEDKSWYKDGKSLQSYQFTGILKSSEVLVSMQCLLELFKCCSVCLVDCCITVEGHERQFSVTQDCQSCGHHRVWRSRPTSAEQPTGALRTHEGCGALRDEVCVQTSCNDDDECVEASYAEVEVQIALSDTECTERGDTHEWESRLDEEDVESAEEDAACTWLDGACGTAAVWCAGGESDAMLSCSTQRRTKAFEHTGTRDSHKPAACFQKHVEKEQRSKPLYPQCQEYGKCASAESGFSVSKDHGWEHTTDTRHLSRVREEVPH